MVHGVVFREQDRALRLGWRPFFLLVMVRGRGDKDGLPGEGPVKVGGPHGLCEGGRDQPGTVFRGVYTLDRCHEDHAGLMVPELERFVDGVNGFESVHTWHVKVDHDGVIGAAIFYSLCKKGQSDLT